MYFASDGKEQELVFQMCWSISLTRVPGWEPACTQEEDVMSIIKNAEDETERSLKNIKAVGFLISFGCLRLKHALTAHEKLLNYSLFQLYALPFSCHWQVRQIITVSQHQMTSRHKINVLPLRCSHFLSIGVHQWESHKTKESEVTCGCHIGYFWFPAECRWFAGSTTSTLSWQMQPWAFRRRDCCGTKTSVWNRLKVFKMLRMLWMLRWMLASLSITWLNHSHPGLLCFDGWRPSMSGRWANRCDDHSDEDFGGGGKGSNFADKT